MQQIDVDKFTAMTGFSTKASAQVNLAKVFRKLKGDGIASPDVKKKSGGRKRKAREYTHFLGTTRLPC